MTDDAPKITFAAHIRRICEIPNDDILFHSVRIVSTCFIFLNHLKLNKNPIDGISDSDGTKATSSQHRLETPFKHIQAYLSMNLSMICENL